MNLMTNIKQDNPSPVDLTLENLGARIALSRKARGLRQSDLALMAGVGRSTVVAIEKGSPEVTMGNYARALNAMGILDQLSSVANPLYDLDAVEMMTAKLPERVRLSKKLICDA
jgi:transcriptional regulator with XRE-family HTH domain